MKRLLYSAVLLVTTLGLFAQVNTFHAELRSMLDGERIMYAKITSTSGDSRLTNSDGYVSIPYVKNDVLLISHLSYDSLFVDPADYRQGDTVLFYLSPRTYQLAELTFSVLGPRYYFDNRFAHTDLGKTDAEKVREKLEITDMKDELVALDQASSPGVYLGSPITALYDRFSKQGKELRRYQQLLARDFVDSLNREKYNLDVVQRLAAIESRDATQDFMDFCSFDQRYIEQSTFLEIYFEIIRCKEEYDQLLQD